APKKLLQALPRGMDKRATRETVILAAVRLARSEPDAAAEALRGKLGAALESADQKYLWGRVAYEAARKLVPEAISWYTLTDAAMLNDEQLAWRARTALRAADWATVRDSIDRMSVIARQDPAWTYWYARALGAQGQADGAKAYFTKISGQPT